LIETDTKNKMGDFGWEMIHWLIEIVAEW